MNLENYIIAAILAIVTGVYSYIRSLQRKNDILTTQSLVTNNQVQTQPLEQQVAQDAKNVLSDEEDYEKALNDYRPGNGNAPSDPSTK